MDIVKPKKSFKVNLISADTASWSGTSLYNHATYPINFRSIIRDPEDYQKKYKMTFSFTTGASTSNSVWNDAIFLIELDFKKASVIAQNDKSVFTYNGNLNGEMNITASGTYSAGNGYFSTKPRDNTPAYMENLQDIDRVTLSVYEIEYGRYFPPNSTGTLDYMCIITFTEI